MVLLTLVYTLHYIDRSVLGIVLEPLKDEFELTDSQLGVLTGLAYSVPFALSVIPVGILADRVNRSRLLAAILFIWSAMTAACGFAVNFVTLLLARMAVGTAESGASPTCMSLVAEYFQPQERAAPIGFFFLASSIGTIVTFSIGGLIVAEAGWRWAFILAGAPGIALALVLLVFLKDPRPRGARPQHGFLTSAARIGRMPGRVAFINLIAAGAINTAVVSGGFSWAASFFIRIFGFDIPQAGLIVALGVGVAGGLGTILSGHISDRLDRIGPSHMLLFPAVASVALAVSGSAFAFAGSAAMSIALFMVWCLLATCFWAPTFSALLSLAPEEDRGFAMSITQLVFNLVGYGMGPIVVGLVSDLSGSLRPAIAVLTGMALWAALHFALAAFTRPAGAGASRARRPT